MKRAHSQVLWALRAAVLDSSTLRKQRPLLALARPPQ
jgi:hypothetical protein